MKLKPYIYILQANFHFHADYWSGISTDVQDLIRKMLTLDQKLRWSARQLLSHPWITAGDDELASHDLTGSLTELKRYNARRRLRAAADAVIMANRIARLTSFKTEASAKTEVSKADIKVVPVIDESPPSREEGENSYKPPSSLE